MTQAEVKKLASEIIGDGQTPNQWFVTTSPYVKVYNEEVYGYDDKRLEGYDSADDIYTYGPFDTYAEAFECFDDQDLGVDYGVGQVCIEDRECGTVTEKWLKEKVTTVYEEDMHDDSHLFYKS